MPDWILNMYHNLKQMKIKKKIGLSLVYVSTWSLTSQNAKES